MSPDRTVLDHLLEGREALVQEVDRLTTAINELDAVIGRLGGGASAIAADGVPVAAESAARQPVNASGERVRTTRPARARSGGRKMATRRSGGRRGVDGDAPKSIRVRILEMLAAEDRTFGLAEIIERIHGAGIQAHDDAVRSITIKLMRDGRVERVGRGQYRLTTSGARPETPEPAPTSEVPVSYPPPLNLAQPWDAKA
jgi:hypothetical protein